MRSVPGARDGFLLFFQRKLCLISALWSCGVKNKQQELKYPVTPRHEETACIRDEWQLIVQSCGGFRYCRGAFVLTRAEGCACRRQPAALSVPLSCSPKHISSVPCVCACVIRLQSQET